MLAKRKAAEQKVRGGSCRDHLWAALAFLVWKKDDMWKFCINYCKLNVVTKKKSYPLACFDSPQVELLPDASVVAGQMVW